MYWPWGLVARARAIAICGRRAAAIGAEAFAHARRPAVLSFPLDRAGESQVLTDPNPVNATFPITRERLAGYREATAQSLTVAVAARNSATEGGRLTAAMLSASDPPDAIAAMSDEVALGAIRVAPNISITGWADSEAAEEAGLTTVWQSLHDQGAECVHRARPRPERRPARVADRAPGVHERQPRVTAAGGRRVALGIDPPVEPVSRGRLAGLTGLGSSSISPRGLVWSRSGL